MSTETKPTNGESRPTPKPPQEQTLLESQERERRLVESLAWGGWDGFGGSDTLYDLFQDRYGSPGSGYWIPISLVSDRKRGDNWPIWRNDFELSQYRQRSRIICRKNSYARSLLFNLQTHIIGKGFTYKVQPKKDQDQAPEQPGVQAPSQTDQIVDATQKFVDKILIANRFTATVNPDPDQSLVTSSREWETARRTYRDGETIIRLFCVEEGDLRGMTFVRFVEPEQVTNPSAASPGDGWSYGMRHATEPFEDEEDIKEYYVKYKDATGRGEDGEYVSAEQIVHIKNLEEDAATKRGLPAFSLDMIDSLERASNLMRNVSTSSGVRAATAEIWQHENASEAQVQSMVSRSAERTFTNPTTGRMETQERTRPGSTRRIPQGQKPLWPQAVGAAEHIEVLQGDLRQAGIVFAAPEYFTGDASNANFSSTKEAGAPFVIASEVTQAHFKTGFMVVVIRAIIWAIKCGILHEKTLDVVELQVTAPTISVRDPLQTAQEDQILIGTKIKSVKTAQAERGLDSDHEAQNNEEFDAKFGQQGGTLPMPGDGGDPFGMGGDGGGQPPKPQLPGGGAGLESLDVLENFTGIDSHGHKWVAGKQVKKEDDPVTKPKRAAPGSQLQEPHKAKLRELGMTGTFPPADVPLESIKFADLSKGPEELKFVPLMSWNQNTGSGRVSRQYRYTQAFHDRNAAEKFDRVMEVEPTLPAAKKKLAETMASGNPREKEGAAIASIIMETGLRPTDSDESVKHGHYGVGSILAKHVSIDGGLAKLDFIGKEGVRNKAVISDPNSVKYLSHAIAGKSPDAPVFSSATSQDALDQLKEATGLKDAKLKDLRTIRATQEARKAVDEYQGPPPPLTGDEKKDAKAVAKAILAMSGKVAVILNNTATMARDNYIHPKVFEQWQKKLLSGAKTPTMESMSRVTQFQVETGSKRNIFEAFGVRLEDFLPSKDSEQVELLENFTGVDSHGHRWENGKQVAIDGKDDPPATVASPEEHVETWASYASKIPTKVMHAARTKVKGHYDRLAERYGQNTARAIVAAGIVAFPLPGGTLIGPAPIIAVAELVRWFKAKRTPAMESEETTLTPEEIARLGKEFIAAVMADESKPVVESQDVEAFLLESGFTGVLTDRLGHHQHYRDGVHVAGPTAIDVSHASHPKAKDLAEQAVKLWGDNAKAKLEEAIAKHADDADLAAQRKVMAAKVALAGLANHHDIGDFDLRKEFAEPAPEKPKPLPAAPNVVPAGQWTKLSVDGVQSEIEKQDDYEYYALRHVHDGDFGDMETKVGDTLPDSFRWDDDEKTEDQIDGTSVIGFDKDDQKSIENAIKLSKGYTLGGHTVLVGSNKRNGFGQDRGEVYLKKPTVIASFGEHAERAELFAEAGADVARE